jgi:hypothetical protein
MDTSAGSSRRKLTDDEKAFRRANNLCSYCGEGGHYAAACPKKKGFVPRKNTASTSSSAPAPQKSAPEAATPKMPPSAASLYSVAAQQPKN